MPPRFRPGLYRSLRPFVRGLFRAYFRIEVRHAGRVPPAGGLVMAANHASYVDPVLLATFSPRPVHFMMLRPFYEMPVIGFFAAVFGSFPVDGYALSKGTLRAAEGVLRDGEVLGIFPEGGRTRDGKLLPAKPGTLFIALRERVPVVPVALSGTFEAYPASVRFPRPRRRLTVTFGEPFTDHLALDYPRDKDRLGELTGRLMERISALKED